MSHPPSSHHDHPPHHGHSPGHHGQELSVEKKLAAILEHWIRHNESHANGYREWAQKAAALALPDVRARIEEALELTLAVNRKFEDALQQVRRRK
jgi:hypothetical protein